MDLKVFAFSTKAMMYYAVFIAVVIGLVSTTWVGRIAAICLFLFELSFLASEGFTCPKCWLGTLGAGSVILLTFGFIIPPIIGLAIIFIVADVLIHSV